jgi:hypothetical protein
MKTLLKFQTILMALTIALAEGSTGRATGTKAIRSDCIFEIAQNDTNSSPERGPWSGTPAGPAHASPAAEASMAAPAADESPFVVYKHHRRHHHKAAADSGASAAPAAGDAGAAAPAPAAATP